MWGAKEGDQNYALLLIIEDNYLLCQLHYSPDIVNLKLECHSTRGQYKIFDRLFRLPPSLTIAVNILQCKVIQHINRILKAINIDAMLPFIAPLMDVDDDVDAFAYVLYRIAF